MLTAQKNKQNLEIYNSTVRTNLPELKRIETKQKIGLLLFFLIFIAIYKSLMSELADE